jgi:phospho-N-acetylmuramoyl-pentapeptide-transferase
LGCGWHRFMRQILIAAGMALAVALLLPLVLIRVFTRLGFGQEIRDDAPKSHQRKRGTPQHGRPRDPHRDLG